MTKLTVKHLERGARYLTPSGRVVRYEGAWAPAKGGPVQATFLYVPQRGESLLMTDMVCLTESNLHILARVS